MQIADLINSKMDESVSLMNSQSLSTIPSISKPTNKRPILSKHSLRYLEENGCLECKLFLKAQILAKNQSITALVVR